MLQRSHGGKVLHVRKNSDIFRTHKQFPQQQKKTHKTSMNEVVKIVMELLHHGAIVSERSSSMTSSPP